MPHLISNLSSRGYYVSRIPRSIQKARNFRNPSRIPPIYSWLFIFLVVLLGINLTTPIHAQNNHKKNVLVLNSYNYGYGWSDSIMKGIEAVLPLQTII